MLIVSMCPVGKCKEAQEVSWRRLWCDTPKLLPQILQNTSLQLELDIKSLASSIPDADTLEEARTKLQELLNKKYLQLISQNAMDIGRTNLIELDIPTESTDHFQTIYSTAEIPQIHRSQNQATRGVGNHFAKDEQLGHPYTGSA